MIVLTVLWEKKLDRGGCLPLEGRREDAIRKMEVCIYLL